MLGRQNFGNIGHHALGPDRLGRGGRERRYLRNVLGLGLGNDGFNLGPGRRAFRKVMARQCRGQGFKGRLGIAL